MKIPLRERYRQGERTGRNGLYSAIIGMKPHCTSTSLERMSVCIFDMLDMNVTIL
ncbi:hypothetical protein I7V34_19675 [Bacillus sp. V3]|nr:hypothetical protein I7V34_19675 [Bacillus sp. V3]